MKPAYVLLGMYAVLSILAIIGYYLTRNDYGVREKARLRAATEDCPTGSGEKGNAEMAESVESDSLSALRKAGM